MHIITYCAYNCVKTGFYKDARSYSPTQTRKATALLRRKRCTV